MLQEPFDSVAPYHKARSSVFVDCAFSFAKSFDLRAHPSLSCCAGDFQMTDSKESVAEAPTSVSLTRFAVDAFEIHRVGPDDETVVGYIDDTTAVVVTAVAVTAVADTSADIVADNG